MPSLRSNTAKSLEFGTYRYFPSSERLLRGTKVVPLRPKTLAVLTHLLARCGLLVTREELLDAVWPGAAVTDDTLTQSIAELRRVLRDDARKPRFIETAHRRGFRFVAVVQEIEQEHASPLPGPVAGRAFVGRAREIADLSGALDRARKGERQLVLVAGEAGAGKTELVQTFLCQAREQPGPRTVIARGKCVPQIGQREPYMAVVDALDNVLRSPSASVVRSALRRYAPTWAARLPQTRERGPRARGAGEMTQAQSLRELTAALEAVAADHVVIVVLEDMHWADPSTMDLLTFAAMRDEPARLLIVATYRPADAAATDHPIANAGGRMATRHAFRQLGLAGLSGSDVQSYLSLRCPELREDGIGEWLQGRTGGNALLVATMTDHLVRELGEKGSPDTLSVDWRRRIPADIGAIMEHQVAGLPGDARRLLDAACVAGCEFDAQELVDAIDGNEQAVEEWCRQLDHHHGLFRPLPCQEWPDGSIGVRYAFRHELCRQWLYDRLPPVTKRTLHDRIGRRLETGFLHAPTGRVLAQIAGHFEFGGDRERAVEHLRSAAVRALETGAVREARQYVEAALPQLQRLTVSRTSRETELVLLRLLARIEASAGGYSAGSLEALLRQIIDLARELDDKGAELEARYATWHFHSLRGSAEDIPATLASLRALVPLHGDRAFVLHAYAAGATELWSGKLDKACASLQPVVDMSEGSVAAEFSATTSYGMNPFVGAAMHLAHASWPQGKLDRARQFQVHGLEIASRSNRHPVMAGALGHSALIRWMCGDRAESAKLAVRARKAAEDHGMELWSAIAEMLHGAGTAEAGSVDEGVELLQSGLRRAMRIQSGLNSVFYVILVTICLETERIELGLRSIAQAFEVTRPSIERFVEAELWRLRGELTMAAARTEAREDIRVEALARVDTDMRTAMSIARGQGASLFALRAALGLAKVWELRGGQTGDGPALLQAALDELPACEALPEAVRARDLLCSASAFPVGRHLA